MATIDKEQVDFATKLNAAISSMATSAERAEKSFDSQVTIMEKLADAVRKINAGSTQRDLESLNKTKLDGLMGSLDKAGTSAGGMTKRIQDAAKVIEKDLPVAAGAGAGALSGLYQGFKNVLALGKGITGFFGGVIDSLVSIAASIIAIPFKMFSGLMDLAANASGMNELAQAVENLRKEFGKLSGPTTSAVLTVTKTLKGFSDTGLSAWRVFGTLAERLESITKLAVAMGGTFGVLRKEFERNGGAVLAYQKGLGISDEQMTAFAQKAITQGSGISDVLKDTAKFALELGKAFGVDSKVISKDMAKAMVDVKHFAGATVKQIAEAATYARKLGLELDKITGTLDAFETFDTAAENAAKLSQSFGVTVDAFKLMEAQSPADQLDQLRKAFGAAGKSADTMSRQELKLLAQTTGLDEATAKMAFSTKNQGLSLDEIKKKSGEAEKKTLTQTEAMVKLADSIERMVKSGSMTGSFFDMFIKGISDGFQSSKEFRTVMIEIRQGLMQVYQIGRQLGILLPKLIPDLGDFLRGLGKFFDPKKFTTLFRGIKDAITWFTTSKDASLGGMMDRMKKSFFDFFDSEKPAAQQLLNSFKRMFKKLAKLAGEGIVWVSKQLADGMRSLIELITHPDEFLKKAKAGGSGALGFIADALMPLVEGLKQAWNILYPPLKELLGIVFTKLGDFLSSSEFRGMIAPFYPIIAAVLFGPMIGQALVGALTTTLIKSLAGIVSGGGLTSVTGVFGRLGTMVGPTMGLALGVAAVAAAAAYIGYEGKKLIDETFEKGRKADINLRNADIAAFNATGKKTPLEAKLKEITNLQEAIKINQEKLADKGFGEKALDWVAGTNVAADQAADALAKSKRTLQDLQSEVDKIQSTSGGGIDLIRKKAEDAAKANKETFGGATSVTDATQKIQSLEELSKKLKGKNFDVKSTLAEIQEKLKGVSFDVLTPEQAGSLAVGNDAMEKIHTYASNILATFGQLGQLPSALNKVTSTLKAEALQPAFNAIHKMIESVKKLDDAMSEGNVNKLDVVAKLSNLARASGMGAKANYAVQNKGVNITLNLSVTMDVGEVEKVVVLRKTSIIRDRLNYLTDTTPGVTQLPENTDGTVQQLKGTGRTQ